MAKKCSVNVGVKIDNVVKTGENSPVKPENILRDSFKEKLTQNNKMSQKSKETNETFFFKVKTAIKDLIHTKYDVLDMDFSAIKDGKEKTINFSYERVELMAHAGDLNKTTQTSYDDIQKSFRVSKYDEKGGIIEGASELLSPEKTNILGNYTSTKLIISMNEQMKKMYFRDAWENQIMNPEQEFSEKELKEVMPTITEYKNAIQDDINNRLESLEVIEKENIFLLEMAKYAKKNNVYIKNISTEQQELIRQEVDKTYKTNLRLMKRVQQEAKEFALNRNFTDFLKFEMLPNLKQEVYSDPQIIEAYENVEALMTDARERLLESEAEIGRDVSYLYKNEDYMKVVIQDINNEKNYTNGRSPLGIDLSIFVGQKGSTKEMLTNIKLSSYLFMVNIEKNIHNSKAMKIVDKTNVAPEVVNLVIEHMQNANIDINNRLLDKTAEISQIEIDNLNSAVYNFNKKTVAKYPDLEVDGADLRTEKTFRDKDGQIQKGSINEEIQSNIKIAIENEKNHLKILNTEREFDEFFEMNPTYKDVMYYLEGKNENISTDRLYKFVSAVNSMADIYINKQNTLYIKDLIDINEQLNSNILDKDRVRLNKILKMYLTDKEGKERYVLTDRIGNRVGYNEKGKLGSLFMEDFNQDDPTKFAEWMAMSFYIDADLNSTVDFLKKDKIMILPSPMSNALTEMKNKMSEQQSGILMESLKNATTVAKLGMLFSPTQVIGYNIRNTVADTYAVLMSQPQAFKEFVTDRDVFTDLIDYALGNPTSDDFSEFLRHTETFFGLNQEEILKQMKITDIGEFNTLKDQIQVKKDELSKRKILGKLAPLQTAQGITYFKWAMKKYMNMATHASGTRELVLRYAVYKSKKAEFMKEYNETGKAWTENWGASKQFKIENILNTANENPNIEEKLTQISIAAMEYANQAIISYKDSSHTIDNLSRWTFPFLRFTDGNIRLHYRLMENFVHAMSDNINLIKSGEVKRGLLKSGKTLGLNSMRGGLAFGIPVVMWNAAMLALQGMDLDDIPEYHAENGYFVAPPILNLFGYDQALMITNSDTYAEMLSILGLDELNLNLRNAVIKNIGAFTNEDLEGDLFNDVLDAFSEYDPDPVKSFWDKAVSMGNPFVKALPELVTGKDYYPEGPVGVGYKYTVSENVVRKLMATVGLAKVYTIGEQLSGTPRGMDFFETFGVKSLGTKQDAWTQQRSLAYTYSEEVLGKTPFSREGYGTKIDYMRDEITQQLKYGNYEDARESIINYVIYMEENTDSPEEMNAAVESLRKSLKSRFDVIPSSAIPQKEMQSYVDTLSQQQINDLILAYEYQRDILGPFYEWIFE